MKRLEFKTVDFKKKANSYRAEWISKFVEKLNPPRIEINLKPLPISRVAMLMSHIKTSEIEYFYNECKRAKNFSKKWWWTVKPKKT